MTSRIAFIVFILLLPGCQSSPAPVVPPAPSAATSNARESLGAACRFDNAEACNNLGILWQKGDGGPVDPEKARAFYDRSCSLGGDGRGCGNLGALWFKGEGVPKDVVKARQLWDKACNLGHGTSCDNLGRAWLAGDGGPKDEVRARESWNKAARSETARAAATSARPGRRATVARRTR
jgi:hypothetical protein